MRLLQIPPREYWPRGFTTDYVTTFPDKPILWAPTWWNPLTWARVRRIDLLAPSWWHDLRYYLGTPLAYTYPFWKLRELRPLHNRERLQMFKTNIDILMRRDFESAGMHPLTADAAERIVNLFGRSHYWWADDVEYARALARRAQAV